TVGFSVQIFKGTALTSIIGFVELSKAGTVVTNATFQPFTVYGLVALIYFAGIHIEIDAFQHLGGAKALADFSDFDE
ncbi:hypothetical protein ACC719_37315, partial [Rhizobium ruizarguesonis]